MLDLNGTHALCCAPREGTGGHNEIRDAIFDVTMQADRPAQLLATRDDPQEAARWALCDLPCPTGYAAALVGAGHGWRTTICL